METTLLSTSSPPLLSSHLPPPPLPTRLIRWTSPPDDIIKLNFGGSLSPVGAAAGYLLRDSRSRLIKVGVRFMYDASILVIKSQRNVMVSKLLSMQEWCIFTLKGTIVWSFGLLRVRSISQGEFRRWFMIFELCYQALLLSPFNMIFGRVIWPQTRLLNWE